jgi:glycosyltransferase involved in cell wall biosynthesis
MNQNLLITTPYLNTVGGTEVETITTASYLYDTGVYQNVSIFSPTKIDLDKFYKLIGSREINVFTYPSFFSNPMVKFVDRIFFKLGFRYSFFEYFYWKYMSIRISTFFILAYPKCVYFFSIIDAVSVSKKVIGKITMGQFDIIPDKYKIFYNRFNSIIVFNDKQRDFWVSKYQFNNVFALDIMIPNEVNLLKVNSFQKEGTKSRVFGFLGRIAKEKNILDMILLLDFLNNTNDLHCKLIIQGIGDYDYCNELAEKVKELKLLEYITFNDFEVDPLNTHDFFKKIDIFLVTSISEGGPITALEAAAAGRIVLGYDIGAMSNRFAKFPFLVNRNFKELCHSAITIVNMKSQDQFDLALKIKENYKKELSNRLKGSLLLNIVKE